jgi:hypothetical protein
MGVPRKPIEIETESKQWLDERTGFVVKQKTIKKGLLNQTTESIEQDSTGLGWTVLRPGGDDDYAVEWLRDAKRKAQDVLAAKGLLTDHHCNLFGVLSLQHKIEPLSKEEAAAKLIDSINSVLAHENKIFALHALRLATNLHFFLVATGLNEHVIGDIRATEGRNEGPKKKAADVATKREIIRSICGELWSRNSALRASFSETARQIDKRTNDALAKAGLKPIKAKAIAEHIRNIFPSMASNGK